MSSKLFFDVFPNLNIDNELDNILSETEISKVCTGVSRDDIRIYMTFNTLIPKRRIWALEKCIKNQIFKNQMVSIRIIEDFNLSSQYNPQNLFDAYNDSILEEIEETSALLFNIYKSTFIAFR